MLSKREIKWLNALKNKKYRFKHRAYIAEGPRLINELILNGQTVIKIFKTRDSMLETGYSEDVVTVISESELKQVSGMVQPNGLLAVFEIPGNAGDTAHEMPPKHPPGQWGFALDFIQDPGNLGTIIRTLAWLGIEHLYCSHDSVDIYNPKVVQASMGAIARLQPSYVDLPVFLRSQEVAAYAADMTGDSIGSAQFEPGIVVLGNEGRGLSVEVRNACQQALSIPRLGGSGGESLNVAVSAAIFAAWFTLH